MNTQVPAISVGLSMVSLVGLAAEPAAPPPSPNAPIAAEAPAPNRAVVEQAPSLDVEVQAPNTYGDLQPPLVPSAPETAYALAIAQEAHHLGYARRLLNGKIVYYCKSDASLGTRLPTTKCYTEDQMWAVVQSIIANHESFVQMEHKSMARPP